MHNNKFNPQTINVIKIAVVSLAFVMFIDTKIQVTWRRKRLKAKYFVRMSGIVKLAMNF